MCVIGHTMFDMGNIDQCPECNGALWCFEGSAEILCLECPWTCSTRKWTEWWTLKRGYAF